MPEYAFQELTKFNQPAPAEPQHSPHPWVTPVYSSRQQQTPNETSKAPLFNKEGTQCVQSITTTFLHYGCAVDPCILPALNEIASKQSKPTTNTTIKFDMLMDYLHTNPNTFIWYHASDMILKIVSDAAFLVLTQAQILEAAIYHL